MVASSDWPACVDALRARAGQRSRAFRHTGEVVDDLYNEGEITYSAPITTKAFIKFDPDHRKLKNLGWFVEGEKPVICRFKFQDIVTEKSYIKVEQEFYTGEFFTNYLEVVDRKVYGFNLEAVNIYLLSPLREKP